MASQASAEQEIVLNEATVVDTDVHIGYGSPTLMKEYSKRMEKPYGDYIHPDKATQPMPVPGFPYSLGGKKELTISDAETQEDIEVDLCEQFGVDHPIINSLAPLDDLVQEAVAVEQMSAINDVLVERFLDGNDDFYGVGSITTRNPHKSAEEIDRIGNEDQIVGAFLVPGFEFSRLPGDPSMDIVYQALEDNDLTPVIHAGLGWGKFPVKEFETMFSIHSLGFHWTAMATVTSLIAQGVPEKFPDLDFMVVESGLAWLPNTIARLNREYGQWKSELPLLEKTPEEYLRESFYFSNQPLGEPLDPQHMQQLLEIVGPEMMVFSTDYPHFDFDHPSGFDSFLQHFTTEEREQVLNGNAKRVFDLDI